MSRLQKRFDEITAIDFFQAPERATAKLLLKKVGNFLSGHFPSAHRTVQNHSNLRGKVWVTRKNLFVDRIACGWLIRRFKDGKYARNETGGLQALLTGLVASHPSDDQRMESGCQLFDNLYAYFHRQKKERQPA